MKKSLFVYALGITLLLFLYSCASLPEKERSTSTQWKQKTDRYELKKYLPEKYSAAAAKYSEAEANYKKNKKKAKALYEESITEFKKIVEEGLPLFIDDKTAENERLVQLVKAEESSGKFKTREAAEADIEAMKKAREEKKMEEAADSVWAAVKKLQLLLDASEQGKKASVSKARAERFNLHIIEKEGFNANISLADEGVKNFDNDNSASLASYKKADEGFNSLVSSSMPKAVDYKKELYSSSLKDMKEYRGHLKMEAEYSQVLVQEQKGRDAEAEGRLEEAWEYYDAAEVQTGAIKKEMTVRKTRAGEAIDKVKQRLNTFEENPENSGLEE
jgi:hypothetical protein